MRIVYLLTSLGVGGAEKQVVAIAERMTARGHTIAFIVLKHADEELPVKLPVLRLNMRKSPQGVIRGLRFAKNFLSLFRPDIIHSHTFPANLFARLLRFIWRANNNSPIVINTIHNVYEGGWHRMFLYRLTDSLSDGVTAVSSAAAERFTRLRAMPGNRISILTNGIDTFAFVPDRKRRKSVRVEMRAPGGFIWLAVGRLAPAKDYPNLLRAFAEVRNEIPNAELWIAGDGDRTISGLEELDNESGVSLLGLRRDIADLLDAADGFVLSSAWEGMPLALGEAMAMEKPVVATDVGGVRELLGDVGLLTPAKDSRALAVAMLRIMHMDAAAKRFMGHAARVRIETCFSLNVKVDEWEKLYEQMLCERGE